MPLGYQDLLYFFQSFLTAFLSLEDGTDQPIRAGFFSHLIMEIFCFS